MTTTIAKRSLSVLRAILHEPTAPFREQSVINYLQAFAARLKLNVSFDAAGNVSLQYRHGRRRAMPKWVFAAHMDHPGFIAISQNGRTVEARFAGSVGAEYFPKARVRFFGRFGQAVGSIIDVRQDSPLWLVRVKLDHMVRVDSQSVGMWDLPAMTVKGQVLSSRACDDLVGCASVLCAMQEIARRKLDADVTGFFTRAEEAGFIGAISAARSTSLPKDCLLVAIETSLAQVAAQLGDGVVVRVGDRSRTFDPALTAHLHRLADGLAKTKRGFKYARQLMPGGTCESTAYAAFGYRAAALCVPLANYHNRGPQNRIACEQIHLGDFQSLVSLLVACAADKAQPRQTDDLLRDRLNALLEERGRYLHEDIV